MDSEDFKITIDGVEYHHIDDVPEKYRDMIRRQVESARSTAETAAREASDKPGNIHINKHFKINFNAKRTGAPDSLTGPLSSETSSTQSARFKILFLIIAAAIMIAWKLVVKR
jgi:hypothetical protein